MKGLKNSSDNGDSYIMLELYEHTEKVADQTCNIRNKVCSSKLKSNTKDVIKMWS